MIVIRSGAPLESSYSAGCPYTRHCRLPREETTISADLTWHAIWRWVQHWFLFSIWHLDFRPCEWYYRHMIPKVKHVFKLYSLAIVSQTGSRWHTVDPKWGWCPIKKWQRDNGTWWSSFFVLLFPDFSQDSLQIYAFEVVVGSHIYFCTPFARKVLMFSPTFISDQT